MAQRVLGVCFSNLLWVWLLAEIGLYRIGRSTDDIGHTRYHALDRLLTVDPLTCRYDMLCRIYTVQIQLRKHVPDHADCTAPTRQHELDHTDHEIYLPCLADLLIDHDLWEYIIQIIQMYPRKYVPKYNDRLD